MDAMNRPRCDQTPAWALLQRHFEQLRDFDLREAFAADARRFERFSQDAPHVFADLSKNRIDDQAEALLLQLARECGLAAHRDAMFAGQPINATEGRAVLHTLLRAPDELPPGASAEMAARHAEMRATREAMLAFAEQVRADTAITDVVNIGIGGSDLGPKMAVAALDDFVVPGKRFHFVSNVDGHELAALLKRLEPQRTLFLIASKTFTTAETLTNARSARRWFEAGGGSDVARHFAALTTNVEAARAFGITTTFGFWDWVGGRYSMWSAIGLPLAIAIGAAGFKALLAGAHTMDRHFREAPLPANLPVRLGLLDLWYRNFYGFTSRNIAPYHSALRYVPSYLQQLEMESNGKRVDLRGQALPFGSSPVLWGEPGTNGQHAFFQMLHQGTDVIPVEFVAVRQASHALDGHHAQLLANALAQAQALMRGSAAAGPSQGSAAPSGGSALHAVSARGGTVPDAGGHRHFTGNRPSSFLLLDRLTPESLGALIALQEHRVFVSGSLWGINSFDQWGVELGKVLARDIEPRLASGDLSGLDGSTAGLLKRLRAA